MSYTNLANLVSLILLLITINSIKLKNQNFLGKSLVKLDDILIDDYNSDHSIEKMDVPHLLLDLKNFMKEAEVVMSKIETYESQKQLNELATNITNSTDSADIEAELDVAIEESVVATDESVVATEESVVVTEESDGVTEVSDSATEEADGVTDEAEVTTEETDVTTEEVNIAASTNQTEGVNANETIEEARVLDTEDRQEFLTFSINERIYNISSTINRAPISEILTILNTEIGLLKESYGEISETNLATNAYIRELRELVTNITNKYNLYSIQKNHKIEIMNQKALTHLHLQLESALLSLKQNIGNEEQKITDDNLRIEEILDKLPSEDSSCHLLFECGECVAEPTCGWCASSNRCVEGNEFAPHKGECSFYNFNKCSDLSSCEGYTNCTDCLADVGCGWCNGINTKVCIRKTDGEKGLCRSTQFYHIWRTENNECPEFALTNYFDYIGRELEKASHEPIPQPVVRLELPNINEIIELNEDLVDFYDKKKRSEALVKELGKEYDNTLESLECVEREQNKTLFIEWNKTVEQQGKIA
jgi:hypothetical protein